MTEFYDMGKGDQDGEAEDGETLGVVLSDVVEVNVLILLLADEQNVTLECKLWPWLKEACIDRDLKYFNIIDNDNTQTFKRFELFEIMSHKFQRFPIPSSDEKND